MAQQLGAVRFKGKVANVVGFKNSASRKINKNFMRERVTGANPRTEKQATQRCKAKPAKIFYDGFQNVLNHAFLPNDRASRNRNEFMSLAMKNTELPDVAKTDSYLPLNSLQISKGALGLDFLTIGTADNESVRFENLKIDDALSSQMTIATLSEMLLNSNPLLSEGQELTFLAVLVNKNDASARIAAYISFVLDPGNNTTTIDSLGQIVTIGDYDERAIAVIPTNDLGDDYYVASAGVIISSKTNSSWLYTSSFMYRSIEGEQLYAGESKRSVVASYMQAGDFESDKILQQADNKQAGQVEFKSYGSNAFTLSAGVSGTTSYNSCSTAVYSNGERKVIVTETGVIGIQSNGTFTPITLTNNGVTTNLLLSQTNLAPAPTVKYADLGLVLA